MWPGNYFQPLLNFKRILCKIESEEVYVLVWTNFDSFTNTVLTYVACFKNFSSQ